MWEYFEDSSQDQNPDLPATIKDPSFPDSNLENSEVHEILDSQFGENSCHHEVDKS
jgi:hypothetical protein